VIVDCAVYEEGQRTDRELDLREAYELGSSGDGRFVWIGLHDPSADEFDSVAREFDLHELAAEDATRPRQRPKLEVYDDTVFIVLRTVHYEEETEEVETGQIMIFAGSGFVITVRHGLVHGPAPGPHADRAAARPAALRARRGGPRRARPDRGPVRARGAGGGRGHLRG
jgi:Mg2+ and Co2+ transporter CorA